MNSDQRGYGRNWVRLLKEKRTIHLILIILLLASLSIWTIGIFKEGTTGSQFGLFFLKGQNFLADFTNVVGYSAELNPYYSAYYSGAGEKAYPPLSYLIMYPFSRLVHINDYFERNYFLDMYQEPLLLIMYILTVAVVMIAVYETVRHRTSGNRWMKILTGFAIVLCGPMIYSVERGNQIMLAMLMVMVFLFNYDSREIKKRVVASFCLAIAASLKIMPALAGILLITDKKYWKDAFRTVIIGLMVFIVPFFFLKCGPLKGIYHLYLNITYNIEAYSGIHGCTLASCLQCIGVDVSGAWRTVLTIMTGILLLVGCAILPKKWERATAVCLMIIMLPGHSEDYNVLYLIPALILFLNEEEHALTDWLIVLGFLILFQHVQFHNSPIFADHRFGLLCLLTVLLVRCVKGYICLWSGLASRKAKT